MAKNTTTASKKNVAENTVNAESVSKELIAKGFNPINVSALMELWGSVFTTIESVETVLEKQAKAEKENIEKKKAEKENKNKVAMMRREEDQKALENVFKSIGHKSVPSMMNDVRDENRFALKVLEKGAEKTKVHDRDLVGLRFTSGNFNLCFQAEIPFERTTGGNKFSLTPEEHMAAKEKMLGEIAKVILSAYSEKGEFIL